MRSVRFTRTHDGLALAWTRSGSGPPLVKAANWLTHLEHDPESPVWSHWVRFLESHFDYLRHDERGCGLSDRSTGELSVATWTQDLERVIEAAAMPEPFVLLAMSQGTAAAVRFAVRHPEKVSHLVICGGYARGVHRRDTPAAARLYDAIVEVVESGWDMPNEAFRETFTRRFVPDGDPERIHWFNDLCRRTTSAEVAAALLRARGEMDVSETLPQVRCPTLVLHAEADQVAPLEEGRFIAQSIPTAELVVLPSPNHVLQPNEPAWAIFMDRVLDFTGATATAPVADLSRREREILAGLCAAKSNKDIARDLGLGEKTVRNHLTRIFAKLGVASRQEAIVKLTKGSGEA